MQNTPLARAATQISKEIIKPLQAQLKGRYLASINPNVKGDGKSAFEYTHISEISDAAIQWNIVTGTEAKDGVTASSRIVQIPCLYKEFEIPKGDIDAWDQREVGVGQENSLQSVTANAAAYKVGSLEDTVIFDGWKPNGTDYVVKGFAQAAGSTITGGSISTVGTMFEYVCSAVSALESAEVYGENNSYNLSITPTIMAALRSKRYMNGDREQKQIEELLVDGAIYVTPHLPAGTAIVTPVDTARQHIEFLCPIDYRVSFAHMEYDDVGMQKGVVYERFCPSYTRPKANGTTDAIAKITNLSA